MYILTLNVYDLTHFCLIYILTQTISIGLNIAQDKKGGNMDNLGIIFYIVQGKTLLLPLIKNHLSEMFL